MVRQHDEGYGCGLPASHGDTSPLSRLGNQVPGVRLHEPEHLGVCRPGVTCGVRLRDQVLGVQVQEAECVGVVRQYDGYGCGPSASDCETGSLSGLEDQVPGVRHQQAEHLCGGGPPCHRLGSSSWRPVVDSPSVRPSVYSHVRVSLSESRES